MINHINNSGLSESLINEIISFAVKYNLDKVVLFGSRARGDYRERSDIDLAIWGGDSVSFALDVDEETNTLLMFDFVDFNHSVQEDLKISIQKEGKVLYEK